MIAFDTSRDAQREADFFGRRLHSECAPVLFERFPDGRIAARFNPAGIRACPACHEEHDPGDEQP